MPHLNAMQIVVAVLFLLGMGALGLAAWFGRKWPDPKTMPYRDANGISYGRIKRKEAA